MRLDEVIITSENKAMFMETPELYETISLEVVHSEAVVEDQIASIKLFFGSWFESGDEDKQLEELYRSRLIPSTLLNE
jgi:hypothetical protein